MRVSSKQLAAALVDVAHGATPAQAAEAAKTLVAALAAQGRLPLARKVVRAVDVVWRDRFGASRIRVASAHPLARADRAKLEALAPGADFDATVDEALIGGAVIRLDDRLFDGSVAGALKRLEGVLITSD